MDKCAEASARREPVDAILQPYLLENGVNRLSPGRHSVDRLWARLAEEGEPLLCLAAQSTKLQNANASSAGGGCATLIHPTATA